MTRHGVAPQTEHGSADALVPETVKNLYWVAGGELKLFVESQEVKLKRSFLRHSDKVRTKYTGQAILAGAYGLRPSPERQEDLAGLDLTGLDIREDPRLGYGKLEANGEAIKALGWNDYANRWFADPDASTFDGKPITPYRALLENGRASLKDALVEIMCNGKELGVLATHASIVEPLVIAAVESAREKPVRSFDEIGGQFDMEKYAQLVVDFKQPYKGSNIGLPHARVLRDGREYKVNLAKLI